MKGGVYDVAFRKIKIFKSWSQKVKSQDQSVKLALIELTCYQNCLTCLGAMISPILKRWEQRFLFKTTMKKRKRRFLGPFHPKTYCLNRSKDCYILMSKSKIPMIYYYIFRNEEFEGREHCRTNYFWTWTNDKLMEITCLLFRVFVWHSKQERL